MERGRWEGQNFQPLKEVQRLEENDDDADGQMMIQSAQYIIQQDHNSNN